ncbi:MAG: hypothetical protein DLM54_04805, partial [Acidimicrobiales bacterium]
RLRRETESAQRAAEAARLVPAMLGGGPPRHYFIAFQNNAELRATGGLIGNWGELTADAGRLRLTRFGRLQELNDQGVHPRVLNVPPEFLNRYRGFDVANSWQQVNVSPDFPTTARIIADLYPQSGGRPIDGVIAVDPPGLASLLQLTGPVQVPGWPDPVTAANVVDITLRGAYERYPVQEQRVSFLGEVSRRVFEAFTAADLGGPANIARFIGGATRGDHLMAYLQQPQEQDLVRRVGADGSVPAVQGDSLMVVDQNLAANKVDFYLHRRVRYDVTVDPSSRPARITGRLEVALDNQAPSQGLPNGVIGPYDQRFAPGENRTYLSLYTPFLGRGATIDGSPLQIDSRPELGRLAMSTTVSIPSRQTRTVALRLDGRIQLGPGGWYRLDIGHQPVVNPDQVQVSVSVPKGWRIAQAQGIQRQDSRHAGTEIRLDTGRPILLRIYRSGWSSIWHRLLN